MHNLWQEDFQNLLFTFHSLKDLLSRFIFERLGCQPDFAELREGFCIFSFL